MLINLSNHHSSLWKSNQLLAAQQYGVIEDWDFPLIDPTIDNAKLKLLVDEYFNRLLFRKKNLNEEIVVHLMGELTFSFALIYKLLVHDIKCIASTSNRRVVYNNDVKEVYFDFVNFREFFI